MSRSKKAPYWTEGYKGTWRKHAKRKANKAVRKDKTGAKPKKLYNPWDICDFKFEDKKNPKASRK